MKKNNILLSACIIVGCFSFNGFCSVEAAETVSYDDLNDVLKNSITKIKKDYSTGDLHRYYELQKDDSGRLILNEVDTPGTNSILITYNFKNEYGTGDSKKYFEWQIDDNGNKILTEVQTPTQGVQTITLNYDSANPPSRLLIDNTTTEYANGITTDFIGISKNVSTGTAYGGAIYNEDGTIGNITGNFISNSVFAYSSGAFGGAIHNTVSQEGVTSKIGNITGDFVDNYAYLETSEYSGVGAISNYTKIETSAVEIGNIKGNFINNRIYSLGTLNANGAAISNFSNSPEHNAIIGDIEGNFIGNSTYITEGSANGGAIYNGNAQIGNITGDFQFNKIESVSYSAYGSAIYNSYSTIKDINGNFISNGAITSSGNNASGAIYNISGQIGTITGDFTDNYAYSTATADAYAGAIYNSGFITGVNGNFANNYAVTDGGSARGGAIYNSSASGSEIGYIMGNFTDNYVRDSIVSSDKSVTAAAIYNWGKIGSITGDFLRNYAVSSNNAFGSAIFNGGSIDSIFGLNFTSNYSQGRSLAYGGFLYNQESTIGSVSGKFTGNYAVSSEGYAYGGAIYNARSSITEGITGDFENNYVSAYTTAKGGAISNNGTSSVSASIGTITGDFSSNSSTSTGTGYSYGGAIHNYLGEINKIKSSFYSNSSRSESKTAYGGAIHNELGKISEIWGNFELNNASGYTYAEGGALVNIGTTDTLSEITYISGNFISNTTDAFGTNNALGGAIYNSYGKIGQIDGYFSNNSSNSENGGTYGGAIYNSNSQIGIIDGDFTNNQSFSKVGVAYGGAIYNTGSNIDGIDGSFIGNSAVSGGSVARGGAIYNNGTSSEIKYINGNLADNYVKSLDTSSRTGGAAIYNGGGTIGNIQGNILRNSSISNNYSFGGAILNSSQGKILSINSTDIKDNYSQGTNLAYGGFVYNESGEIGSISGDFAGNYAVSDSGYAYGGAIYNSLTTGGETGKIGNITSNFSQNYVSAYTNAYGGAIRNYNSEISDIQGLFTGNYAISETSYAYGGAINNTGKIGEQNEDGEIIGGIINSNFTNNFAKSNSGIASGGAIYTSKDLNIISDNYNSLFSGNYTENNGVTENNAIYVGAADANLTLKTVNNGTIQFDDTIKGTSGYTLTLTGDDTSKIILNNEVSSTNAVSDSVTLKLGTTSQGTSDVLKDTNITINSGVVDVVDSSYTNYNINKLTSSDVVRYSIDMMLSKDKQTSDTFTVGEGSSGTVYLSGINVVNNAEDNATYILPIIKALGDEAPQLAYDNSNVFQLATPVMTSDTILASEFGLYTTKTTNDSLIIGGLRDSFAEWAELDTTEDKIYTFVDNSTRIITRNITDLNGSNITIQGKSNILDVNNKTFLETVEEGQNVSISDITIKNTLSPIENKGVVTLETVTLETGIENENQLNLKGTTTITGDITAVNTGNLDITDGIINLNNTISNQDITITNSSVNIGKSEQLINNSLTMNSGNLNIGEIGLSSLVFDTLSLYDGNINIDNVIVDLANEKMGQIKAASYSESAAAKINVNGLTLVSDGTKDLTSVMFVEEPIKDSVVSNVTSALGPIYKYVVNYSSDGSYGDDGYFVFNKNGMVDNNQSNSGEENTNNQETTNGGENSSILNGIINANGGSSSSGNNYKNYNPAIFVSPIAAQLGGYLIQLNSYDEAFRNMDMYMLMSKKQRQALKYKNKYAAASDRLTLDTIKTPYSGRNGWMRPFATFENVKLKNGPKVSNVTYGSFAGLESEMYELPKGWDGIFSVYAGYNGSHQSYQGNSIYQNGGTLGFVGMAYKGNFFTGLTANAGANSGQADTMYGKDNFSMLLSGVASKSGYNFEFKDGKYIIQPNYLMSYSFINTFDYTNAAGVRINSDPLHALQIEPGVKFIGNLKNGWQPYASVSVVMNIMDKTQFKANDVSLPSLSINPFVKYGVGVRKTYGDNFIGYIQSFITNGGRNGIGLQAGFRWLIGGN